MSENEELEARGRIVTDYMEAKARLAALESEMRRTGEHLQRVGDFISQGAVHIKTFDSEIASIPTAEKLRRLADEFKQVRDKRDAAQNAMKQLGIEIS